MKALLVLLSFSTLTMSSLTAQNRDAQLLIAEMLGESPLEEDLQHLCDNIGGRETGSAANTSAVEWAYRTLTEIGVKTWKQDVPVPSLWLERSTQAKVSSPGQDDFHPLVVSKYHSSQDQISAPLVYVGAGGEDDILAKADQIPGALLLVETELCMDINGLFAEYGQAFGVEQLAVKHGAAGVVFMSSRPRKLLYRFTTSMGTNNSLVQIVMAREDAKRCLRRLDAGESLQITINIDAQQGEAFVTHNVIAEIPGSDLSDEIILIGAHIDSWALGTGANDNGCNVSLVIDIARQIHELGIRPRRTIRFALWNGEEQGFFGSQAYTEQLESELDRHKMAMSIDIGSGRIIGFFDNGNPAMDALLQKYLEGVSAFGPYLTIPAAVVGTDNLDFMLQGVPNLVANHKPYNYGLNYHASSDTYDKVDLESLKINSAIVAAVTWGMAMDGDLPLERWDRPRVEQMMKEQSLEFSMRMFDLWDPWLKGERGLPAK